MTPADLPTPEKPSTSSDPPPPPRLKGWGRLRGDKAPAPAPPPQSNSAPPPKIETVQPVISVEKKMKPFALEVVSSAKDTSSSSLKASSSATPVIVAKSQTEHNSGPDYAHLNDRLNRIEQLISDLMVKVDDKTRSIEKSVAKVKHAKSKHAKPHQSVTICVDSPQGAGGTSGIGGSNNDCDEQFL